ncbi:MAG: glycosyltransferase family 25 protein [Bacteroidota bacterium]
MSHTDFEVVYYINLPHRADRKLTFERSAQYLPVKEIIRFEAVDGSGMDSAWPGTPGAWGCRESHIRLLEMIKEEGHQKFMIIEDDAIVKRSFKKRFNKFLDTIGDDWDMIYLHTQGHYLKPIKLKPGVIQLQNTLGTVGIAYNARNLDVILDKLKNDYRWVDSCMADLHVVLKVYAPTRPFLVHSKGFSDNINALVHPDKGKLLVFMERVINKLKRIYRGF